MNQNGSAHSIHSSDLSQSQSVENIDWNKVKSIFRRNRIWVLALILGCNLLAYLYVRYTKPLYESYSDLKLEVKSEASTLGLSRFEDNYNINNLSGEIELINSRLFFNKVLNAVDIDVQYFTYGNILDDEKYKHSPFKVYHLVKNGAMYGSPIDLKFLEKNKFNLSYKNGSETFSEEFYFGDTIRTNDLELSIEKTNHFNSELMDELFYFKINTHEALIKYLEDNISVEPLNLNANSIRISFKDYNKFKAFDLVNAIDTLYLEYTSQEKNLANEGRIEYLDSQLKETEKILEEFENYFENFTIDNKTVDLDQDVKATLVFINSLDSQRFELLARIKHIEKLEEQIITEELKNINLNRKFIPADLLKGIEELDRLSFEYEQLKLAYNENTYTFERKKQELDLVRGELITELNQYKINLYESLNDVRTRKSELETRLTALPSKGTEYNKAKRYYSLYEEMYLSLMQSKNEFEIARAGTIPDFKILSSASLPNKPISPNTLIVYGSGVASGFILSFLFLGLTYLLNNKITGTSEVEGLTNVPIAGSLPVSKDSGGFAVPEVARRPKSAVSEAFRSIRTSLEFIVPDQKQRIISVSSAISGEGKTFVTLNLASVIALSGKKVLIMDLDLRRPKIHKYLNGDTNSDRGISTILIDKNSPGECIRKTQMENLHYIPSGPTPPNPSELLLSQKFKQTLNDLSKQFDTILLDTPPIGLVADAVNLMKSTHLNLFVVRCDYSRRPYLQVINRLKNVNKIENLALVVNAVPSTGGYGYGYGYGYGRGESYYDDSQNGVHTVRVSKKNKAEA